MKQDRETILVVDDEAGVRHFLRKIFSREYHVVTAGDGGTAVGSVRDARPDLVLLDLRLPDQDGLETLRRIREMVPDLPVILITAYGDTDKAIQAIEAGAFDYLTKPLDIEAVRQVIRKGLKARRLGREEGVEAVAQGGRLTGERLIGNSPAMVEIYKVVGQVAKSDVTVLILGESGTGKDLVARTLHRYSLRSEGPFVAVNCAAIPETLLESELFGYEAGAFDYLTKPLDIEAVRQVIRKGLKARRLGREEGVEAVAQGGRLTGERLIGNSPAMVEIYKVVGQVAKSDVTVLILGESGTGKDLVARTLHRYSLRSEGPFVAVNCAAIPETLLESELFGYEAGAFTGARAGGRAGKFEAAAGGTLFLDEIGDMSLATQSKVLRVLQDGSFQRLGGSRPLRADVRIVAATNRDLGERIREGLFREDLFHRLNVVTIRVPPLRERPDDIPPLAEYFVHRFNPELRTRIQGFEAGLLDYLREYDWPGNVRELENLIKKAMVLSRSPYLALDFFREAIPEEIRGQGDFQRRFALVVENALQRCLDGCRAPYETILGTVEKILVKKALEISGGNQVRAAKLLGITRTTLRKKIAGYGL